MIMMIIFLISGCKKDKSEVAELTTTAATEITSNSVRAGGNITSDGGAAISSHGVCFSQSAMPTVSDSKVTSGSGTGIFTVNITGLTPSTTYYARAYAINEAGTAYGNQITFTTAAAAPVPTITYSGNTLWIHPTDNASMKQWSYDSFIITGATSVTNGSLNTSSIVNILGAGDYAAKICNDLTVFGHSDWYLPSLDELMAMEDKKTTIGGFDTGGAYWSSTEYADYYAYIVYFSNGMYVNTSKTNLHNVRCIRKQ